MTLGDGRLIYGWHADQDPRFPSRRDLAHCRHVPKLSGPILESGSRDLFWQFQRRHQDCYEGNF